MGLVLHISHTKFNFLFNSHDSALGAAPWALNDFLSAVAGEFSAGATGDEFH